MYSSQQPDNFFEWGFKFLARPAAQTATLFPKKKTLMKKARKLEKEEVRSALAQNYLT